MDEPIVFTRLTTLGDTTRSRTLALLEQHELTVSELCEVLQLPQSTVSRHLRILSEDGWVTSRAQGTHRHYRMGASLARNARELWDLVREEMSGSGYLTEDRERARAVLARRLDRSRAFFSASSDRWDAVREELFGQGGEVLPLYGLLDPRWTVGDLGAGTGQLALALAPFVRRVVAVDRSPEMLDAARCRLQGTPDVELREGELEALPVEDGELDLAILSLVLHYVAEPPRVLAEARRALAPGGRVVIVDMRAHAREEYREAMGHLWLGFEPARVEAWLDEGGFGEVAARPLAPGRDARGPLLFLATGVRER